MRILIALLPTLLTAGLAGCGAGSDPVSADALVSVETPAPTQLGLCASCHGRSGIAVIPDTPNLAGRDREELLAAMQAYLDGTRDHGPMRAMLGPIRPAERERLAEWYAAQPAPEAAP